jgi:O-antigen/teichoic acid export membrane protein
VKRQLFWAALWKGVGLAAAFAANVVIARVLGAEGAGWVAFGQSTATVASTIALLGIDYAAMRELSALWARGALQPARTLVATALLGGGVVTMVVVVAGAGLTLALHASGLFFRQNEWIVLFGLLVSVGMAGSRLLGELLRATGAVGAAVLAQSALGPLVLLVGVCLGAAVASERFALSLLVLGEWLAALWAILWWQRHWLQPPGRPEWSVFRQLFRSGATMFFIGVGTVMIGWIELTALSYWYSGQSLAMLNVALRVASLVSLPLLIINLAAAPRYAALYATGELGRLRSLVIKITVLSGLCGLLAAALLLIDGIAILRIFGPAFIAANLSLRIVLIGQVANVVSGPVMFLLMMSGRERAGLTCVSVAVLMDLAMVNLLVPRYGLTGAAISNAIAVCVMNGTAAIVAYGHLFRSGEPNARSVRV